MSNVVKLPTPTQNAAPVDTYIDFMVMLETPYSDNPYFGDREEFIDFMDFHFRKSYYKYMRKMERRQTIEDVCFYTKKLFSRLSIIKALWK